MRFPFDKPMPRISSPYGWRIHPILKTRRHHNGIDYAVEIGRPVKAIEAGKVLFAGPSTLKFPNGEPAGGGYTIHTFNTSGTFVANRDLTVEALVVAGGGSGSGATGTYAEGGGGGGGGYLLGNISCSAGSSSLVTV